MYIILVRSIFLHHLPFYLSCNKKQVEILNWKFCTAGFGSAYFGHYCITLLTV
ncbi:hypothetical protein CDL12_09460 [Handroanthus impetiginosus]|uniref:Uncharacterized protein n=1 Tax=Handroanthus impetiginosus TaxID=429701 RepID=A0A2G9HK30_9LAMI|nr:hypothetical protein CDL12_09460 [Handroanthus impetiginosus]